MKLRGNKKTSFNEFPQVRQKKHSSVSVAIKKVTENPESPILANDEYTLKIANSIYDKKRVYRLAYEIYLDKGFIQENNKKEYTIKADLSPDATILFLEDKKGHMVGSMTLITDSSQEVPASNLYKSELNQIKAKGNKIVEFSRFVIAKDERNSKEILSLLTNYTYLYAYHQLNGDVIVAQVNPSHQFFYKHILQFDQLGQEKECPVVRGAPAVLMVKSMQEMKKLIEICLKRSIEKKTKKMKRLIYNSYFNAEKEADVIRKMRSLKSIEIYNRPRNHPILQRLKLLTHRRTSAIV